MNFSMSKKISDVVSSGYFKKTLYTLPTRCWVSIIVFLFTTSAEIHTFRCGGKFCISEKHPHCLKALSIKVIHINWPTNYIKKLLKLVK